MECQGEMGIVKKKKSSVVTDEKYLFLQMGINWRTLLPSRNVSGFLLHVTALTLEDKKYPFFLLCHQFRRNLK